MALEHGTLQARGRQADDVDRDGAFVQGRQKLRAELHKHGRPADQQRAGHRDRDPSPANRQTQHGRVHRVECANQRIRMDVTSHALRNRGRQDRNHRQRHHQRRQHRKADRHRQRSEHLAFQRLKRKERNEHHHHDENGERHRSGYFAYSRPCDFGPRPTAVRLFAHMARDVFGHDDRRVDHHAHRNHQPAQAHQVGRDVGPVHEDERRGRRQRQRQGDRQCRLQVPQQQKQDRDDEETALRKRARHGADAGLDQVGAVVERSNPHPRRQRLLDLGDLLFHAVHDELGVLALEHDRHADDGLAASIPADAAEPGLRADLDLRQIAQVDRYAVFGLDHDPADILSVFEQALGDDVDLLEILGDEAHAAVAIVALDRLDHVPQRNAELQQHVRVHHDVELAHQPAHAVDFVQTGQSSQLRRNQPFLNRP